MPRAQVVAAVVKNSSISEMKANSKANIGHNHLRKV
jgi:hypothetical protein